MYTFSLKNIDGRMVSPDDYPDAPGMMVIFTCNHCPYAIAYEMRLNALHESFAGRGLPLIAINPNDATRYPLDSFAQMQVRAAQRGFKFPYLHDESQEVAASYGAERTPHAFLLRRDADGHLTKVYEGAIDDNWEKAGWVRERYLADAAEALLLGQRPNRSGTMAVGCSVKWKS